MFWERWQKGMKKIEKDLRRSNEPCREDKDKKMSETIKFEQSSGNVFRDIGFSDVEAERELLKADLAFEIYSILEERKLTQTKAGEILGINQSDISRLKNGDFSRFSVERLFAILNRLNRNIEIRITPSEDRSGHQRVVAV